MTLLTYLEAKYSVSSPVQHPYEIYALNNNILIDYDKYPDTFGFEQSAMYWEASKWFTREVLAYNKYIDRVEKKVRYIYMLTFTLNPKKQDTNSIAEVREYIENISKRQRALHIEHLEYAEELTKKGVPHWHVVIETLKPLKKDRFNYYTCKWGFLDFSSTKAQHLQNALNYITKDQNSKVLIKVGKVL